MGGRVHDFAGMTKQYSLGDRRAPRAAKGDAEGGSRSCRGNRRVPRPARRPSTELAKCEGLRSKWSETVRARGTPKGDKARYLLWLVEADGSRRAEQDKGRRRRAAGAGPAAQNSREFIGNNPHIRFCTKECNKPGTFAPPAAEFSFRRRRPDGLWSRGEARRASERQKNKKTPEKQALE